MTRLSIDNCITILDQYSRRIYNIQPHYSELPPQMPVGSPTPLFAYQVSLRIEEHPYVATGDYHSKKKSAKAEAAYRLCEQLEQIGEFDIFLMDPNQPGEYDFGRKSEKRNMQRMQETEPVDVRTSYAQSFVAAGSILDGQPIDPHPKYEVQNNNSGYVLDGQPANPHAKHEDQNDDQNGDRNDGSGYAIDGQPVNPHTKQEDANNDRHSKEDDDDILEMESDHRRSSRHEQQIPRHTVRTVSQSHQQHTEIINQPIQQPVHQQHPRQVQQPQRQAQQHPQHQVQQYRQQQPPYMPQNVQQYQQQPQYQPINQPVNQPIYYQDRGPYSQPQYQPSAYPQQQTYKEEFYTSNGVAHRVMKRNRDSFEDPDYQLANQPIPVQQPKKPRYVDSVDGSSAPVLLTISEKEMETIVDFMEGALRSQPEKRMLLSDMGNQLNSHPVISRIQGKPKLKTLIKTNSQFRMVQMSMGMEAIQLVDDQSIDNPIDSSNRPIEQ